MRNFGFAKGYNVKRELGVDGLDDIIDCESW